MKKPNIIRLSDKELMTAYQDLNFIFGFVKQGLRNRKMEKEYDYFISESAFKKMLDKINQMSETKFKKK